MPGPGGGDGPDDDMLDGACDPNNAVQDPNQDGDSGSNGTPWLNSGDNCPRSNNPTNEQAELSDDIATARPRGGPAGDALGDPCDGAETICTGNADDDAGGPDGLVNDGCPTVGSATAETTCTYASSAEADNDGDGWANDGCPQGGSGSESGADCADLQNDDSADDALVNDGCPIQGGPELGCLNSTDDEDNPATAAADGDGAVNDGCPSSANVASGHFHTTFSLIAKCIGGTDSDNDGYCLAASATVPADPNGGAAAIIPETYSQYRPFPLSSSGSGANPPASREPFQICNDGIDNDGDTFIDDDDDSSTASPNTLDDCRPPDTVFTAADDDTDGDGHKDTVEALIGTDALGRCGEGSDPNGTTQNTRWPSDLRGEGTFSPDRVNVSDLGTFTSPIRRLGSQPGQAAFNRRWDLRPANNAGAAWITVADMSVVSTQVAPPMFGVRAFGIASACSSHRAFTGGVWVTLND